MALFDTHCHIQSAGLSIGEPMTRALWARAGNTSVNAIVTRAHEAGVTRLLCVGCDIADSQLAIDCAQRHDNCWASIGIHPHEAQTFADQTQLLKEFAVLVSQPKVAAIGECGLDFHYAHSPKASQVALLKFQIELALEHNLPLIFHVREAFAEFWPIFESYQSSSKPIRGVLHSFTDTLENMERAIKHGLFLGVNGIATFAKDADQREVYRRIPQGSLLLETDAPYLTPYPYRGKICEPYHVRTIAEFLAVLREETVVALSKATTVNACQLFNLR